VAANVSLPRADGITYVDVETADELRDAAAAAFEATDVVVMAAAVADFKPAEAVPDKITKDGREGLSIELEPTADVLSELAGRRRSEQLIVGFAAEHGPSAVDRARGKLDRKRLDAIVVNDVSRADIGFDVPQNEVTIVTAAGDELVPRASKAEVAGAILDVVERLRAERTQAGGAARA